LKPWLLLLPASLLLNACTAVQVTESDITSQAAAEAAYRNRTESLRSVSAWSLVGRISLDDGEEGGSGRLQWVVNADRSSMDFHGAMGRGAWHLESGPEGAVLQLADGGETFAAGVDALIQQQLGWPVPVAALRWWVLGLAAPGPVEAQQLEAGGLLTSLQQFGWQIDFNRYASQTGVAMPIRLDARQDNYRVKLAVSRWNISIDDIASD